MPTPRKTAERAFCPKCGQKYAVPVEEMRRRPGLRFRATCRSCHTPFSVTWRDGRLETEIEELLDEAPGERDVLSKGARVGKYEIEGPLASGGSSTVYRAFDQGANRTVALKVLHQAPDADHRLRFWREVEVQGNLKHQNLMPIFDHGTVDGKPYYTMELLKKPMTLDTIIGLFRSKRLTYHPTLRRLASLREMIRRVLLPVARAIAFANANGIVHRDLKPSNVIVDASTLRVYVIDFGICHLFKTTGSRLLLRAGEAPAAEDERRMTMGTLRCMPPEQARGEVSERGDVWALGALLRYVLAGDYPVAPAIDLERVGVTQRIRNLEKIAASSRAAGDEEEAAFYEARIEDLREGGHRTMKDLLRDAQHGNYVPLPEGLDPRLAAVVERAMRIRPEDRYASADAFAADLQAWLDGRPVRAYAAALGTARATLYKTRLYVERNRTVLLTAASVLLLVGVGTAIWVFRAASAERRQIDQWMFEARQALDPAVQEDRLRSVLSLRPDHAEARELLTLARRFAPMVAKVGEARAAREEAQRIWASRDATRAERERAQRLAEDAAAVLESLAVDLRSLPADYRGRTLEDEVVQLANQLRGRRVVRLRGLPRGAAISIVATRSDVRRDFAWDGPRRLGTAPLPVADYVLERGAYVLVVRRSPGQALFLPFVISYETTGGLELVCPFDPAELPPGMLFVPGGVVEHGDLRFHEETETVELRPFLIDEHEVTNEEYARYVDALPEAQRERAVPRRLLDGAGMRTTPLWTPRDDGTWAFPEGAARFPVTNVSFVDAQGYARWAGKRLPTAEEWERAASGVDDRDYPFGMVLDLNACNAQTGAPANVGSFPEDRSPFGVTDMGGNAAEWTDDAAGERATVKGGSFDLPRFHAIASAFDTRLADRPYNDVGFRCARDWREP